MSGPADAPVEVDIWAAEFEAVVVIVEEEGAVSVLELEAPWLGLALLVCPEPLRPRERCEAFLVLWATAAAAVAWVDS